MGDVLTALQRALPPGSGPVLELLPFAAGGAGLAGLYLASLWLSVRRVGRVARPGSWMLMGALLRIAGVCGGLWAVAGGQALRVLAGLAGFVVARTLALACLRKGGVDGPAPGRTP